MVVGVDRYTETQSFNFRSISDAPIRQIDDTVGFMDEMKHSFAV